MLHAGGVGVQLNPRETSWEGSLEAQVGGRGEGDVDLELVVGTNVEGGRDGRDKGALLSSRASSKVGEARVESRDAVTHSCLMYEQEERRE